MCLIAVSHHYIILALCIIHYQSLLCFTSALQGNSNNISVVLFTAREHSGSLQCRCKAPYFYSIWDRNFQRKYLSDACSYWIRPWIKCWRRRSFFVRCSRQRIETRSLGSNNQNTSISSINFRWETFRFFLYKVITLNRKTYITFEGFIVHGAQYELAN